MGCAESPYDIARRARQDHLAGKAVRQEHLDMASAEREALYRTWAEAMAPDIRELFQGLVDTGNEALASYFGKVYVDLQEFERCVYFERIPEPPAKAAGEEEKLQALARAFSGSPRPEDPDARRIWTDRFAVAQELSCRVEFGDVRLTNVDLTSSTPFQATVTLNIIGTGRHAIAGDAKPLPVPPEGNRYWIDRGWGVNATDLPIIMRVPDRLPGTLYVAGQAPLADEAVRRLESTPLEAVQIPVLRRLLYQTDKGKWDCDLTPVTSPASDLLYILEWNHGIAEEDRDKVHEP
jgi:hypothetical protein